MKKFELIVIGCSMGGLSALENLLKDFPADYPLPVVIVQHMLADADNYLVPILGEACQMKVKEVDEKEHPEGGVIYIAPPGFHVLLEKDATFTLSTEEKVNFSRPSIDILFETAADCCRDRTVGVILTGGNKDGAEGLKKIKMKGGLTIVQDPLEAEMDIMPAMAQEIATPQYVLKLHEIKDLLLKLEKIN